MKSKKSYSKKIKIKDLKLKLYAGVRDRFIPVQDYRTNATLLHHCRYCKKYKFSKELSIYDGKLIYICPECGGRHKYSMLKVNFQRFLKLLVVLFVAFCALLIFANEQGWFYDMGSSSYEDSYNGYDVLSLGESSYEVDGETYIEYLFVAPEDGYYTFNSLSECDPVDVRGKLLVDGEIVDENDDYAGTKSFYMVEHLEEGEEIILAVDAKESSIYRIDLGIKNVSSTYAKAVEKYNEVSVNGIYVSDYDKVYYDPDFKSGTATYNDADTRYAVDFRVDESNKIIWLAFSANEDGEDFYVWYPLDIE